MAHMRGFVMTTTWSKETGPVAHMRLKRRET